MKRLIQYPILLLIAFSLCLWGCSPDEPAPAGGEESGDSRGYTLDASGSGGEYSGGGGGSSSGGQGGGQTTEPGQLTAGEWNDLANWDFWKGLYENEDLQASEEAWGIQARDKYEVRVVDNFNRPVVNAIAYLRNKDGETIWTAQSNQEGETVLWGKFTENAQQAEYIEVVYMGSSDIVTDLAAAKLGPVKAEVSTIRTPPSGLDVYMVVDATGSMGDEITYIQSELENVIERVGNDLSHMDIRLGATFYRDQEDDYLTRDFDLTLNHSNVISDVRDQQADGGGDWPEAVDAGLEVAINGQEWNDNAVARVIFLILDAPPHEEDAQAVSNMQRLMQDAAAKGIRVIPVSASGIDKKTEFLMRMLALATNGTYTFITDDSGIGGAHIEPTVGEFDVEFLNDLMVRLVREYATH
ncbi:MAG: VWA domain-containing protein [Bacteroidota bacterium]